MCFSCLNLAENGSGTLKFATGQNRQIPLRRLIACGRGSFIDEENCRLTDCDALHADLLLRQNSMSIGI